jgi:hypothetical protein
VALSPEPGEGHPDLEATEARGARPGVPVLWVMVISTLAALIAVFVIWSIFAHKLGNATPPQVRSPAQAARFDTPSSQPSPKPAVP